MLLSKSPIPSLLASAVGVSCSALVFPRATDVGFVNSTTTGESPSPTQLCCYMNARGIHRINWFTSSVEVIVKTVSTIVYQYDDIAITSYLTILANNSQILPSTTFEASENYTFSGVPTTLINAVNSYPALTTLVTGTDFTDPYGVVHMSPTPVLYYVNNITYYTQTATATGNSYACPTFIPGFVGGDVIAPYPSGFWDVDNSPVFENSTGEINKDFNPNLFAWMVTNVPPNADPIWSNLATCTPGYENGIPVAHVPVAMLTSRPSTTITIPTPLSPVAPTAIPVTTEPEATVEPPPITSTPDVPLPPVETLPPTAGPITEPNPEPTPANPEPEPTPADPPTETSATNPGPPVLPPSSSTPSTPEPTPGNPEDPSPEDPTPEDPTPDNPTPDDPTPDDPSPEDPTPDNPTPDDPTPDDPTPEDPTPDDPTPDDSTPDDSTPEDPSPEDQDPTPSGEPPAADPVTTTRVIIIDSSTITANPASEFIIGDQTLTAGGTITATGGATLVLETGGSVVVIASSGLTKTQTLATVPTPTKNSSDATTSMGGFPNATIPFEGRAAKQALNVGGVVFVSGLLALWAM